MFWWLERQGAFLQVEVLAKAEGGYELRLIRPDGSERVEHFTDANALQARQEQVLAELAAEGWSGRHGWVI